MTTAVAAPPVDVRRQLARDNVARLFVAGAFVVFTVVLLRTAWLCDDAYINFRTIDNFLHGYGLRWNVGERVQTYTDPLWVLLVTVCSAMTGEFYYTVIFLSFTLSLAAVIVYARFVAIHDIAAVAGLALLVCSKSFVDYSSSGLENPLTHLLVVAFFVVYWRAGLAPDRRVGILALCAALCALTRLDTTLLLAPALMAAVARAGLRRSLVPLAVGFGPLAAWEIFSTIYYGFPLPNTGYAKLGGGIPVGDRATQGIIYLLDSVKLDPLTLAVIAAGMVFPIVTRRSRLLPFVLGMAMSVGYVIFAAGDFMSGRFLSATLLCAVMVLTCGDWPAGGELTLLPILLAVVAAASTHDTSLLTDGRLRHDFTDRDGVVDERRVYYPFTGLMSVERKGGALTHPWADHGRDVLAKGERVAVYQADGFFGMAAGPEVHAVDPFALGDPLLARLPAGQDWRPGHFPRRIPDGYLETLVSGTNQIAEPGIAAYYTHLRLVTEGPIWTLKRFAEIWRLNTGVYRPLIESSSYGAMHVRLSEVSRPKKEGSSSRPEANIDVHEGGVVIDMDGTHTGAIEISLDANDDYRIVFERRGVAVDEQIVRARWPNTNGSLGLAVYVVRPAAAFDEVQVFGYRGFGTYAMGHLRLLQ